MHKAIKSGLDLTIFTALSFVNYNPALEQFLTAIAGAIGIAFANYILLPFLKKSFEFIKSKINNNDKIPDDLEHTLIDGLDKIKDEVVDKIAEEVNKKNENK